MLRNALRVVSSPSVQLVIKPQLVNTAAPLFHTLNHRFPILPTPTRFIQQPQHHIIATPIAPVIPNEVNQSIVERQQESILDEINNNNAYQMESVKRKRKKKIKKHKHRKRLKDTRALRKKLGKK
jgi:ribosomal protein S21